MSWLKINDNFPDSAKVDGLSDAAARLWVMAACWCRKPEHMHLKGFVPEAAIPTICKRRWSTEQVRELVRELVDATVGGLHKFGLWEPVEGGWKFHDWGQYQPDEPLTASEVARLGGLASAESRRLREGTAVPKGARNRTVTEQVRNQFGQQVHRTDTELTEPPDPDPRSDLAKEETSLQRPDRLRATGCATECERESESNFESLPDDSHASAGGTPTPPPQAQALPQTRPSATQRRDPMRLAMEPKPKLADELFEAYRLESGLLGAKCDGARAALFLRLAHEGVTVEQVRLAVRGAKLDDWARDAKKLSDAVILSSASQREKYMAMARDPPRPKGAKAPPQPDDPENPWEPSRVIV